MPETVRRQTALNILLASTTNQPLQLWMEYRERDDTQNDQSIAAALFVEDGDERYQASEWFHLPRSRLNAFNAFSQWRRRQYRLDVRPDEGRTALEDVTIPLKMVSDTDDSE